MIPIFKKFYRKLFQDKLFIIKVSGKIAIDQEARENLIANIKELTDDGIKVLLIYGGGSSIDQSLLENNIISKKIDGRRITSAEDIKIIKKVLAGDIGFKIMESLVKAELPCNLLNALPPHWARANRRDAIDGLKRFDGTLGVINTDAVREHFASTNLAVFPCLAFTDDGTALNINADNVAVALAAQTQSDKLILMTDIDGVQVDGEVASVLTLKEAQNLIDTNIATDGMRVKLENCIAALGAGVARVHILNGFRKNSLRDEVYSSKGIGTMIVRSDEKQIYEEKELIQKEEKS